ncbi:unnamed protein product [Pleuronectes platessa]|uniref:Uncharacterized protein n=1 Tax=Pleuronectes platessa TaxID=8262 RepID=A0A9N7TIL0_PLEPL|nr:unnamed protein product [Pleuronectes platessa]
MPWSDEWRVAAPSDFLELADRQPISVGGGGAKVVTEKSIEHTERRRYVLQRENTRRGSVKAEDSLIILRFKFSLEIRA